MSVRGRRTTTATLSCLAATCFGWPAIAKSIPPAPVAALIRQVSIPFEEFTLSNGLRVIVHTDRKAPVVGVSVWYDVGSKHEPRGATGFAHLFEHLMFNGTENAPGDFFVPLKEAGATDFNGTTYYDRTNYFETVPTAALPRALFLESDRMGYLLGSITQGVLDEQRGVVQNEKRQGDNQPYGLLRYAITEGLYPKDHPYGHDVIGSMADLDAASLDTVKNWFRDHYGPNNAVLVLAGDIDVATARPMVERYFGAIKRGPGNRAPLAPVPTLPAPKTVIIKDRVAATMITRNWAVPGAADPDSAALDAAAGVLGGLASSRLVEALVRREQLFTQITVSINSLAQGGIFSINGMVRPGVDPMLAGKRLDAVTTEFLRLGPTPDELTRVVTTQVADRIRGLEAVGGWSKSAALAEGVLYAGDPDYYRKQLDRLAALTPSVVQTVAGRWLGRPVLAIEVVPGQRDAYVEAQEVTTKTAPAAPRPVFKGTRGPIPAVGATKDLVFPDVERLRLTNGMEVVYARRTAVPITQVALSFDAGLAADVPDRLGTEQLTLAMLDEGTSSMDGEALAKAREGLGMLFGAGAGNDRTVLSLNVPSINLNAGVDLFSDTVRNPAFADVALARVKAQQTAGIQQELSSPNGLAGRAMVRIVQRGTPYMNAQGGDPAAIARLTAADLRAFRDAWLRPEKGRFFVVSDLSLSQVRTALERRFGDWKSFGAPGTKEFPGSQPPLSPRMMLVDLPDSSQSVVYGVQRTGLKGSDDMIALQMANDALAGGFLSRLNMDLRERRHWTYGAGGGFNRDAFAVPYMVSTAVQSDKTGPAITVARDIVTQFGTTRPMTQNEFTLATVNAMLTLPGRFETAAAVLSAMQENDLFQRPDNYYSSITSRYRALTLPEVQAAAARVIDPDHMAWIVVGDSSQVKSQLDAIGLPLEVMRASEILNAPAPAREK